MVIKKYRTAIKLHITPVWHLEPPICMIRFSKDVFFKEEIKESKVYSYEEYLSVGEYDITIEFLNKKNTDTINGKDKAIKIDKIVFNDINSEKYVWQGIYRPVYPEPWISQQKKLGKKFNAVVNLATYLGWNGVWKLTYSAPIFTWIHKVENHGWIYD
jgi:hypothetical protein